MSAIICLEQCLVEMLKLTRLLRVLGASMSSQCLGSCNISSWSHLRQNSKRLGLRDMHLGSHLGLSSKGLMHIPGRIMNCWSAKCQSANYHIAMCNTFMKNISDKLQQ